MKTVQTPLEQHAPTEQPAGKTEPGIDPTQKLMELTAAPDR